MCLDFLVGALTVHFLSVSLLGKPLTLEKEFLSDVRGNLEVKIQEARDGSSIYVQLHIVKELFLEQKKQSSWSALVCSCAIKQLRVIFKMSNLMKFFLIITSKYDQFLCLVYYKA
jgi:hypothetical protein